MKMSDLKAHQRLWDLACTQRSALLEANLITEHEYEALAGAIGTRPRLDDYAQLYRDTIALTNENARLQAEVTEYKGLREHAPLDEESGLAQIARWVREYKEDLAKSNEGIFDSGLRCVSEGGEVFFVDPEEIEEVMARVQGRSGVLEAVGHFAKVLAVHVLQKAACTRCGETPRGEDPGLSAGICFFCGYLDLPPGQQREEVRLARGSKLKES